MYSTDAIGTTLIGLLGCLLAAALPAGAAQSLGTGNASLIGGDLTDPTDSVELKDAFTLTHFTITTAGPDRPDRDPKEWAIQGSNTGAEDDWTDIYVCNATDRSGTVFQEGSRFQTFLFTSFDSSQLVKSVTPADAKKLQDKLKDKRIEKADFVRPAKAFTHFRVAIYSCFNPSAGHWIYRTTGSSYLGQLELFGVPGVKEKVAPKLSKVEPPATPPVLDAPFIISYWCGPPMDQTTLERYQEIVDCGFNMAFPAIDVLGKSFDKAQEQHNLKYLDICRQVGLKALVYDGRNPRELEATSENIPKIKQALDDPAAARSPGQKSRGRRDGDRLLCRCRRPDLHPADKPFTEANGHLQADHGRPDCIDVGSFTGNRQTAGRHPAQ